MDDPMDPGRDLMVDANAVGGILEAVFGADVTDVPGQCAHCHTVSLVGSMHAWVRVPGTVIRCPVCGEVVLRIVQTDRTTMVDARGAAYIAFARGPDR